MQKSSGGSEHFSKVLSDRKRDRMRFATNFPGFRCLIRSSSSSPIRGCSSWRVTPLPRDHERASIQLIECHGPHAGLPPVGNGSGILPVRRVLRPLSPGTPASPSFPPPHPSVTSLAVCCFRSSRLYCVYWFLSRPFSCPVSSYYRHP